MISLCVSIGVRRNLSQGVQNNFGRGSLTYYNPVYLPYIILITIISLYRYFFICILIVFIIIKKNICK